MFYISNDQPYRSMTKIEIEEKENDAYELNEPI